MFWFYLAGGSVLFFSALNIFQRKVALDAENPRVFAIVFNLITAFIAIIYFFIFGSANYSFPTERSAWIYLLVAIVCFGLYERYRFHVSKLLDASLNSIISNISVLVAFSGALVLYSESLTLWKLTGALLILLALFLISRPTGGKSKVKLKGIVWGIGLWTVLGIGWMLDKKGSGYFGPDIYNVFVWTFPILLILFPSVNPNMLFTVFRKGSCPVNVV